MTMSARLVATIASALLVTGAAPASWAEVAGGDTSAVSAVSQANCHGEVPTLVGTPGEDVLRGTPGPDVIAGLGRADRILGGDGDDVLCGNGGDDALRGDAGDDRLYGQRNSPFEYMDGDHIVGADRLRGGAGDDLIDGGGYSRGTDHVFYTTARHGVTVDLRSASATGQGSDIVKGVEWVTGSAHADVLRAESDKIEDLFLDGLAGPDRLVGWRGGGVVHLNAGAGDDIVLPANHDVAFGNGGDDVIRPPRAPSCSTRVDSICTKVIGGRGDDHLTGTHRNDLLSGGADTDAADGRAGTDRCEAEVELHCELAMP